MLQQEQFVEEMKSLKIEKEIETASKSLQFSPFNEKRYLFEPKAE